MSGIARFYNNLGVVNQGKDNTDRIRNNEYMVPDYAAAITIKPTKSNTLIKQALTGALTLNLGVGDANNAPFVGDKVDIIWFADGTTRTVTFGTGILPTAATQVCTTAKKSTISFIFDGTAWVETSRSVTA